MFKIHNERTKTKRKLRVSLKIYRPKILQIQHLQKKRKLQLKYHSFERFQGGELRPLFSGKVFSQDSGLFFLPIFVGGASHKVCYIRSKNTLDDRNVKEEQVH